MDAGPIDAGGIDGSVGDAATGDATVGDGAVGDGGGGDAGIESFRAIYSEILDVKCKSCHGMAGALNMSAAPVAHMNLVNVAAGGSAMACGGMNLTRVVPGNPNGSLLVAKISAATDDDVCGRRMPPSGDPLTPAQIARIRRWIEQGALDN